MFESPAPLPMAELAKRTTEGVSAVEVNDYTFGNYRGELKPSPPHADLNPDLLTYPLGVDLSRPPAQAT